MARKTSKGKEGYYAAYKAGNKQAKNRKIKLERLLKKQPNNEQIKNALNDIKYRRYTPKTKMWSKSAIATAKLFKEFQGCFNRDILSTNPKTASIALDTLPSRPSQKNKSVKHEQTIHDKRPFSIQARAHLKGVLIWA